MKPAAFLRAASDAALVALVALSLVCMFVFGPVLMDGMQAPNVWLCLLLAAAWTALLVALYRLSARLRGGSLARAAASPGFAAAAFIVLWGVQLALALQTYSLSGWDPQVVLSEANERLLGTPYEGVYFHQNPNNLFLLSAFRLMFTVLNRAGIADYLPWAVALSTLCVNVSVALLFAAARRAYGVRAAWLSFALGAPLAALSPWIAVPYTDTLSAPFPIGCVCCAVFGASAETRRGRIAAWALFGACLALGVSLKPTTAVAAIAVLIAALLRLLSRRTGAKRLAAAAAAAAAGFAVLWALSSALTQWGTGDMLDPERAERESFSAAHYWMMGLSQPYGGYAYEDMEFSASFSDYDSRVKGDVEEGLRRLDEMGAAGYASFLVRKLNFILNDGTFFFGREGAFYVGEPTQNSSFARWVQSFFRADGEHYGALAVWQNAQWVAVLVLTLAGVVLRRRGGETAYLARLSFLGIVLFLLLFEARSRYLFHFLPVIALAALGGLLALARQRVFLPDAMFTRATAVTPEYLKEQGIRALVLDVDNTLTGHGSQELPEDIAAWLEEMRAAGVGMMIVSNNFEKRVAPFADKIGLSHVSFSCKPSPVGFWRARRRLGVTKEQMALVGDQIFTDAVGANLYGIRMLLVQPMYADTKWNIRLKRRLEQPILKRYFAQGGKLYGSS